MNRINKQLAQESIEWRIISTLIEGCIVLLSSLIFHVPIFVSLKVSVCEMVVSFIIKTIIYYWWRKKRINGRKTSHRKKHQR